MLHRVFSLWLAVGLTLASVPAAAADRIVSIGGSVTEILFALGLGDRIIATDTTSSYPAEANALPKVGYMRTLAAEPIVSLAPDLVIAVDHAGPRTILDQIAAAGVRLAVVPDEPTAAGVADKIDKVAAAVGIEVRGRELSQGVAIEFARLDAILAQDHARPSVLYILSVSGGAPLAAGQETAAEGVIALAGGRNAVQGYDGYKPLSPEAALTLDPDLVVIASHAVPLLGGLEGLAKRPDLGLIPAVKAGRVVAMDANYLLGFGPRAAQAARELAAQLHPALANALNQP
jgi:iron complex transport system substrate-binding protein